MGYPNATDYPLGLPNFLTNSVLKLDGYGQYSGFHTWDPSLQPIPYCAWG